MGRWFWPLPTILFLFAMHDGSRMMFAHKQQCTMGKYNGTFTPLNCTARYNIDYVDLSFVNWLNTGHSGGHFADDIFESIFVNEKFCILIKISLKFVPKVPINNIPALVQIIVWRRPGDKLLSGPMIDILLEHICVTRPQWVNLLKPWQSDQHLGRLHIEIQFLDWKSLYILDKSDISNFTKFCSLGCDGQ